MVSLLCGLMCYQVTWCWEALVYTTQHFMHLNGFSHVWVLSYPFKWPAIKKLLSHFQHLKGFSPVWVLSYSFKEHDLEKLLLHFVCLNGISPVCVLSCSLKWPAIEKLLSHFEHLKGFSPVWVLHVQRDDLVTLFALFNGYPPVWVPSYHVPSSGQLLRSLGHTWNKKERKYDKRTPYKEKLANTHGGELFILQRWKGGKRSFLWRESVISKKGVKITNRWQQ